jgi:hypothetical protein
MGLKIANGITTINGVVAVDLGQESLFQVKSGRYYLDQNKNVWSRQGEVIKLLKGTVRGNHKYFKLGKYEYNLEQILNWCSDILENAVSVRYAVATVDEGSFKIVSSFMAKKEDAMEILASQYSGTNFFIVEIKKLRN